MTAIAEPRTGESTFALRAVANEAGKGLQLLWRRRGTLIATIVTVGMTYLMVEFFVGAGRINHTVLARTLPALFAYALAATTALQGSGGVAEEINGGTLEQAQLSPARPSSLMLGRLGSLAAEGLITAAALAAVFWAGFGVHYTVRLASLVPLLLTILDALAYGLLMVALTLRIASIGSLGHVFNMTVMFFGGMFVPVTTFPHGVVIFARFVPTTLGVEVLNATLAGKGLDASWSNGTLPWLLVHVLVALGLGWAIYLFALRRARREGGLSPR